MESAQAVGPAVLGRKIPQNQKLAKIAPTEFGLQVRLPIYRKVLRWAQDFGCGLALRSRPQTASTYRSGCQLR